MEDTRPAMTPTSKEGGLPRRFAALAVFLQRRLDARDETRLWLALTLMLGVIAALAYLWTGFGHLDSIQDDGRMFLSWMGRWDDPDLLRGDLVADFWASVSPWGYKGLFHGAWLVGLKPWIFVRLLPALLFVPIAYFSFRFLRAIGAEPIVAYLTTVFVIHELVRQDIVTSGTPRALWPVLILAILNGLARGRIGPVALAQLLMTGFYPQMAMVSATLIGMTFLDARRGFRLDLSRHRLKLVGAAAAVTVVGLVPFLLQSRGFGPSFTLAEALRIPTFGPLGRGKVAGRDGSIDLICGARIGFFNGRCSHIWQRTPLLITLGLAFGPLVLLLRARGARPPAGPMRSELPFYLLAASLLWFALAALVLFKLHLPNRYSAASTLLVILTCIPLLLEWVRRWPLPAGLADHRAGRAALVLGTAAVFVAAAVSAGDIRSTFRAPGNPPLMKAIRALPKSAVIGGFVKDLDFSPALTGRSTLFNRELAVAYQSKYFNEIFRRMTAMRALVQTDDPATFAANLSALKADVILAEDETLETGSIPERFRSFFGQSLDADATAAPRLPTLLKTLSGPCSIGKYGIVTLLDARCLAARSRPPQP